MVRKIAWGADLPGYTSIMAAVLFLGGLQILVLGILGEYVGRMHEETKGRPLYVASGLIGFDDQ